MEWNGPQSNGMVERFHRHLKGALKACEDNTHWISRLPLILLGIRVAYRDALKGAPAEMVYGESLRLPSEVFLPSAAKSVEDVPEFVQDFKKALRHIDPCPPKLNDTTPVYLPKHLQTCKHVFVRVDKVRTGLQAPYEGPFEVVRRCRKFFTVKIKEKNESISIDRLKPAFEMEGVSKTGKTTNSQKNVRFAKN